PKLDIPNEGGWRECRLAPGYCHSRSGNCLQKLSPVSLRDHRVHTETCEPARSLAKPFLRPLECGGTTAQQKWERVPALQGSRVQRPDWSLITDYRLLLRSLHPHLRRMSIVVPEPIQLCPIRRPVVNHEPIAREVGASRLDFHVAGLLRREIEERLTGMQPHR